MSTKAVSHQRRRSVRFPGASIIWSLTAAALFLGSAALQVAASLQRWVTFRTSREPNDFWGEDHVFDYAFPSDPWDPIGTAAEVFGTGMLIQALGILSMTFGVLTLPGGSPRRRVLVEIVFAVAVAASFAVYGTHAILSGIAGAPSPLRSSSLALEFIMVAGLIVLAVLWRSRSPVATAASVFLLGSSSAGYPIASSIASAFAGYTSHDTTPWTETVIAASTALAGMIMVAVTWTAAHQNGDTPSGPPGPLAATQ